MKQNRDTVQRHSAEFQTEQLYLNFRMSREGKVELLSGCHLPSSQLIPQSGPTTNVSCELLDSKHEVLETHLCHVIDFHEDFDPPYRIFHEVLQWRRTAVAIAFRRNHETVDTISLKGEAPHVKITDMMPLDHSGAQMQLKWNAGAEKRLSHRVRYSNDGGATWRTIAVGLTEPSYIANMNSLPGGQECLFQVATSAGVLSGLDQIEPFAVPRKARDVHISEPVPDASFCQVRVLYCRVSASLPIFPR
jgi:hypothetical protein